MKITSVNVHKKNDDTRMKGIASVLLDDCFVIRDIRIIEGKEGLFIAMPSRKNKRGYRVGDKVRIKVVAADKEKRTIDFELVNNSKVESEAN